MYGFLNVRDSDINLPCPISERRKYIHLGTYHKGTKTLEEEIRGPKK